MKRLKQLNECERSLFAQLLIDGINDNDDKSYFLPPQYDPMIQTTPLANLVIHASDPCSSIAITRIQSPTITENVQSQLFESSIIQKVNQMTINQPFDQPHEQLTEQLINQLISLKVDQQTEQQMTSN